MGLEITIASCKMANDLDIQETSYEMKFDVSTSASDPDNLGNKPGSPEGELREEKDEISGCPRNNVRDGKRNQRAL